MINVRYSTNICSEVREFYDQLFLAYDQVNHLDPTDSSYPFFEITKDFFARFDPLAIIEFNKNIHLSAYQNHPTEIAQTGIKFHTSNDDFENNLCAFSTSKALTKTSTPCLFLDRDGVIIQDTGYPHEPEKLVLLEGIDKIISKANKLSIPVIVVTNQSGIARGKFSEEDYEKCTEWINLELGKKSCTIDTWFFSPYHIQGIIKGLALDSLCRKPNPGMVLKAFGEFNIDLRHSFMIGDKESDRIEIDGLNFIKIPKDKIESVTEEILEKLEKKWRNL